MTATDRALDKDEAEMVASSRDLGPLSRAERVDLIRRLRARRDRAQRMIRTRARQAEGGKGKAGPDTGAHEKKQILTEAIARVAQSLEAETGAGKAKTATANLKAAVEAKAEAQPWRGPDDRTANTGPAETPNDKIAPSGALHAEGMRAAIARSTGDR